MLVFTACIKTQWLKTILVLYIFCVNKVRTKWKRNLNVLNIVKKFQQTFKA